MAEKICTLKKSSSGGVELNGFTIVGAFDGYTGTDCQVGDYVVGCRYMAATETVTVIGGVTLQFYPTSASSTVYKAIMAKATSTHIQLIASNGDHPTCVLLRKN